ncbi:MAG: sigma-70 family RNA polymerase sigma factor [Fuerstiella sp.]
MIRRYENRLVHSLELALNSREDALDAAQQAFLSAWQKLDTFRKDAAFYSWLYRIAHNAAMTTKRRKTLPTVSLNRTTSANDQTIDPTDKDPAAAPDHQLKRQEDRLEIRDALAVVAEEFRAALILKEIDGLSYEQIAEALQIPLGTVRSRIFRARKELNEQIQRTKAE